MELNEAIEAIKKNGIKRVFVQLPEGLKTKCLEIADLLENNGIEAIVCLENTFGACDLRDDEALRLGCKAILHLAHNNFGFEWLKSKLPIYYVEWYSDKDGKESFEKVIEVLKDFKRIGVVYSLQYKKAFELLLEFLEKNGKEVFVYGNGQVIGCNYVNAFSIEKNVDAFVVVSAGKFHAIGLAIKINKPVFVFDVELNEIQKVDVSKYLRSKFWNKKIFEESKRVGLLVSWKKGQFKNYEHIKNKIEAIGKKVYVLAFDELNENILEGLKLDCLINAACPRIAVDDLERYKIPIVDYFDLSL